MAAHIIHKFDELSKDLHLAKNLGVLHKTIQQSFFNIFPDICKAHLINYNWTESNFENLFYLTNLREAPPIAFTETHQVELRSFFEKKAIYVNNKVRDTREAPLVRDLSPKLEGSEIMIPVVPFNQATGYFYACSRFENHFDEEKLAQIQMVVNMAAREHKRITMQSFQIKESKKAEKRYIDQRNLMSELLNYLPVNVFITDTYGKYIFFNQQAKEAFGFAEKDVIGKTAYDLYPKRLAIKFQAEDERVLKSNKAMTFNTREIVNKKKRYSLTGKKVFVSTDKQKLILGFSVDITDLVNTKNDLKERNKFVQLVLNSSPNLMYVKSKEGKYVLVNEAIGEFLNEPVKQLKGQKNIFNRVLQSSRRESLKDEKKVFEGLETMEIEEKFVTKDGSVRWFHTTKKPIKDVDGRTNLLGISVDITTRKLYEEELLSAQRAKERFLANMSHEIRTPINGISGLLNLIKDSPLEAEKEHYLELIKDATNHLKILIDDILDFSLIESGNLKVEKIPFELFHLLETLKHQFDPRAFEKELSLTLHMDPSIPEVLIGDPLRLKQILVNLVGNAIKFTHKGEVGIYVKKSAEAAGDITLEFIVKDTGIGVSPEKQQSIFDSFKQADESITRKFGGTGLGLAISRQLVELMNGRIYINSIENEGSTFSFILPFGIPTEQDVASSQKKEQETADVHSLAGNTVLIVEDNQTNIIYAKNVLKKLDLDLLIAENGKEAIHLLSENEIDLVLMDLQMPVMDGYEATKYIRRNFKGKKARVPIIAVTANALKGERETSIKNGMNDYLSKPFEPAQLRSILNRYLVGTEKKSVMNKLIDLTHLSSMCGGDKEFIAEMVESFIENTPPDSSDMNQAFDAEDWKTVAEKAHKIKPSIKFMGIETLTELILAIEAEAKNNNAEGTLKEKISDFNVGLEKSIEELKQLKANNFE